MVIAAAPRWRSGRPKPGLAIRNLEAWALDPRIWFTYIYVFKR